jgi:hypothetical protein
MVGVKSSKNLQLYGYFLSPMDVAGIVGRQSGEPVQEQYLLNICANFARRLCTHASLDTSRNIIWMEVKGTPGYCVVVATNLSEKAKQPREGAVEKVKEFLGTEMEPSWYRYVPIE